MLDRNEINQVRQLVISELAEVEQFTHRPHGTYTHVCVVAGELCYTHTPVGRVLYAFPSPVVEDTPLI